MMIFKPRNCVLLMQTAFSIFLFSCGFRAGSGADFSADPNGNAVIVGGTVNVVGLAQANTCQIGPKEDESSDQAKRTPTQLVLGPGATLHRAADQSLDALEISPGSSLLLQGGSVPHVGRTILWGSITGDGTLGLLSLKMFPGSTLNLTSGSFFWGGGPVGAGLTFVMSIGGEMVIGPKVRLRTDGSADDQLAIEPGGILRGSLTWPLAAHFTMNGTVIADGFGEERDLDLRKLNLVAISGGEATTGVSVSGGWKAVNRGRLVLPPALPEADGSAVPGQPGADHPTLIGAVRVINADEPVEAAILATDREELKDCPLSVIGAWSIIGAAGCFLELRYDDARLSAISGDPGKIVAFAKTDKGWEDITDSISAPRMTVLTKVLRGDGLVAVGLTK